MLFIHSVVSHCLRPHRLQHVRPPCPSRSPRVCSDSCTLSWWCYLINSSLLLLPSIFLSIRVFSNQPSLCNWWPKYWSFSFNISPSNDYWALISFRIDWFDLLAVQGNFKRLLQHHNLKAAILQCSAFFMVQISHLYMTTEQIKAHYIDLCYLDLCQQSVVSGF